VFEYVPHETAIGGRHDQEWDPWAALREIRRRGRAQWRGAGLVSRCRPRREYGMGAESATSTGATSMTGSAWGVILGMGGLLMRRALGNGGSQH
jgi:hypothetical protein